MSEECEQLRWDEERDTEGCRLDSSSPLNTAWHEAERVAFHLWSAAQTQSSVSDTLKWDKISYVHKLSTIFGFEGLETLNGAVYGSRCVTQLWEL